MCQRGKFTFPATKILYLIAALIFGMPVFCVCGNEIDISDAEKIQTLKKRLFERTLTDEQLAGLLDAL